MDKKEFIIRQIAKTNKKNYENYAITRIIHAVNDPNVKFVTQQYVSRPDRRYALTDLYLPQIGLHVEVDETHHFANGFELIRGDDQWDPHEYVQADVAREADIIGATEHEVARIDARGTLSEFNERIDAVVAIIRERLREHSFEPWNPETELNPATHVERGFIDADDDIALSTHADVCRCFGLNYKRFQRALAQHPREPDVTIWFPKLYENEEWDNLISSNGETIFERRKSANEDFINSHLSKLWAHRRLVFAHVQGPLGEVLYRFKGLYEVDVDESRRTSIITYRRRAKRARTYPVAGGDT